MNNYKLKNWIRYAERYLDDVGLGTNCLSPQTINLLMGYCLEMLLKAILMDKTNKEIKSYGHNINKMYRECLALCPDSPLAEETEVFSFTNFASDFHHILEAGSVRYPKKSDNVQYGRNMWTDVLRDLIDWERKILNSNLDITQMINYD